jgi:hypothetical protein
VDRENVHSSYWINPVGLEPDSAICESLGHVFAIENFSDYDPAFQETLTRNEIVFRECSRCLRLERNGKNGWEVNTLDTGVA